MPITLYTNTQKDTVRLVPSRRSGTGNLMLVFLRQLSRTQSLPRGEGSSRTAGNPKSLSFQVVNCVHEVLKNLHVQDPYLYSQTAYAQMTADRTGKYRNHSVLAAGELQYSRDSGRCACHRELDAHHHGRETPLEDRQGQIAAKYWRRCCSQNDSSVSYQSGRSFVIKGDDLRDV